MDGNGMSLLLIDFKEPYPIEFLLDLPLFSLDILPEDNPEEASEAVGAGKVIPGGNKGFTLGKHLFRGLVPILRPLGQGLENDSIQFNRDIRVKAGWGFYMGIFQPFQDLEFGLSLEELSVGQKFIKNDP